MLSLCKVMTKGKCIAWFPGAAAIEVEVSDGKALDIDGGRKYSAHTLP